MDLQTRKIEFVMKFLKLKSEESLSRFESLLNREIKEDMEPMSMEELNSRIEISLKDSEEDHVTEASLLLEEIEKW